MNVLELVRRPDLRGSGYFGSAGGLPGRGFREDELVGLGEVWREERGLGGGRREPWGRGRGSTGLRNNKLAGTATWNLASQVIPAWPRSLLPHLYNGNKQPAWLGL